jgi:predicted nucleotidyltransferase
MPKIKYKNKSFLSYVLSLRVVVLLSNIIFQGIRYMSLGEKIYKLSMTLAFALIVYVFLDNILSSIIIGHLLNYILNGQFYVVFRYLSSKQTMSKEDLDEYIGLIEKYIKIYKPLDVLVIGSFCRGKMSKTSDLDIRLYHKNDFQSSLKAYLMATTLRFIGLWIKFPIDIFCFSDISFLDKISKDEIPVNFLRNDNILEKYTSSVNYKEQIDKLEL